MPWSRIGHFVRYILRMPFKGFPYIPNFFYHFGAKSVINNPFDSLGSWSSSCSATCISPTRLPYFFRLLIFITISLNQQEGGKSGQHTMMHDNDLELQNEVSFIDDRTLLPTKLTRRSSPSKTPYYGIAPYSKTSDASATTLWRKAWNFTGHCSSDRYLPKIEWHSP